MTNAERDAAICSMRRAAVEQYAREHPEWVELERQVREDRAEFEREFGVSSAELFYPYPELKPSPYERAHPDGAFKAIAQKFGITATRVRQIYLRASHQ